MADRKKDDFKKSTEDLHKQILRIMESRRASRGRGNATTSRSVPGVGGVEDPSVSGRNMEDKNETCRSMSMSFGPVNVSSASSSSRDVTTPNGDNNLKSASGTLNDDEFGKSSENLTDLSQNAPSSEWMEWTSSLEENPSLLGLSVYSVDEIPSRKTAVLPHTVGPTEVEKSERETAVLERFEISAEATAPENFVLMESPVLVGFNPGAKLIVEHETISGSQALLTFNKTKGFWMLQNRGQNGTAVQAEGGIPREIGETLRKLNDRDIVYFPRNGVVKYLFRYLTSDDPPKSNVPTRSTMLLEKEDQRPTDPQGQSETPNPPSEGEAPCLGKTGSKANPKWTEAIEAMSGLTTAKSASGTVSITNSNNKNHFVINESGASTHHYYEKEADLPPRRSADQRSRSANTGGSASTTRGRRANGRGRPPRRTQSAHPSPDARDRTCTKCKKVYATIASLTRHNRDVVCENGMV